MILTVQSAGNKKWRLGISLKDSLEIFELRHRAVTVKLGNLIVNTKTTCGPPLSKGFDLYHYEISNWILNNHYCEYSPRHPKKLVFDYQVIDGHISVTFVKEFLRDIH